MLDKIGETRIELDVFMAQDLDIYVNFLCFTLVQEIRR